MAIGFPSNPNGSISGLADLLMRPIGTASTIEKIIIDMSGTFTELI